MWENIIIRVIMFAIVLILFVALPPPKEIKEDE